MCKASNGKWTSILLVKEYLQEKQLVEEDEYLLAVVGWEGNALRGLGIISSSYLQISVWSCYKMQGICCAEELLHTYLYFY